MDPPAGPDPRYGTEREAAALRREILRWRRSLDASTTTERSLRTGRVASAAITSTLGRVPERVWSYSAHRGELDPAAVTARWVPPPEVALPVVIGEGLEARVGAVSMTEGRFGTAEPVGGSPVDIGWADVVLVPVVAFAEDGTRWGHGKGYYDRVLAGVARFPEGPLLVGLAHDEQEVQNLRAEPWDVPMDAIATPTRWLRARSGRGSGAGQPVAD